MKEEHYYWYFRNLKKMIKKSDKQLYANKLDNLDEMYKFLERHELLKLTQEEKENLNRPVINRLN